MVGFVRRLRYRNGCADENVMLPDGQHEKERNRRRLRSATRVPDGGEGSAGKSAGCRAAARLCRESPKGSWNTEQAAQAICIKLRRCRIEAKRTRSEMLRRASARIMRHRNAREDQIPNGIYRPLAGACGVKTPGDGLGPVSRLGIPTGELRDPNRKIKKPPNGGKLSMQYPCDQKSNDRED